MNTDKFDLKTLYESAQIINSSLEADFVLRNLLLMVMGKQLISSGVIALRDEHHQVYRFVAQKGTKNHLKEFPLNEPPPAVKNIHKWLPISVLRRQIGWLGLGKPMIDSGDTGSEFLETLLQLTAPALENIRLLEERLAKERLEAERKQAGKIQRRLLPQNLPQIQNTQISLWFEPAAEIGGDYADVLELPNNQLLLVIADVSGKGLPAALLMSSLQACIHFAAYDTEFSEMVKLINHFVCQKVEVGTFITFFAGILDLPSGTLTYINAGHEQPFLIHQNRTIERLAIGGLVFGVLPDIQYEVGSTVLAKGDALLLFTDGLSDALNNEQKCFGEERIAQGLLHTHNAFTHLKAELALFRGNTPQPDDITAIYLERN